MGVMNDDADDWQLVMRISVLLRLLVIFLETKRPKKIAQKTA